jgi:hypothetical protein
LNAAAQVNKAARDYTMMDVRIPWRRNTISHRPAIITNTQRRADLDPDFGGSAGATQLTKVDKGKM